MVLTMEYIKDSFNISGITNILKDRGERGYYIITVDYSGEHCSYFVDKQRIIDYHFDKDRFNRTYRLKLNQVTRQTKLTMLSINQEYNDYSNDSYEQSKIINVLYKDELSNIRKEKLKKINSLSYNVGDILK